jgi:hypothetical protein
MSTTTPTPATTDAYVWPADVLEFAEKHNVKHGLEPLRQATLRLFPTGRLTVTFEPDPELSDLDAIVFEVTVKVADVPEPREAYQVWFEESRKIYRPPYTNKEPILALRRGR